MIQAFIPGCSDPSFSICICIWGLKWCVNDMNTLRLKNRIKGIDSRFFIRYIYQYMWLYDQ